MTTRTVSARDGGGWHPTPMFLTAATAAIVLSAAAVALRRVDLVVLATPFLLITAWSLATRPLSEPALTATASSTTPVEDSTQAWTIRATHADGAEQLIAIIPDRRGLQLSPRSGCQVSVRDRADGELPDLDFRWRADRWGSQELLATRAALFSPWLGFRWGPVTLPPVTVRTAPRIEPFASRAGLPNPQGLIGADRSRTRGEGTEFADIRLFQPGDRLRRIHWPVSARTGTLHVRTAYAEQDSEVLLLVDASTDIGDQDKGSSLDLGVHAAAALAVHFAGRGDRLALEVIGGPRSVRVPLGTGQRHVQRVIAALSRVQRAQGSTVRADRVVTLVGPGSLVVLISPLMSVGSMAVAARLSRRGSTVLVVDCLPNSYVAGRTADGDPQDTLALRIRLLEREREIRAVQQLGVPVAAWVGNGSLDAVLRHLARRPVPRLVSR